jgi:hypothetical protein
VVAVDDLAAELFGHELLAVADAEHRHAGLEQGVVRARAVGGGDGSRAAGEDDAARPQPGQRFLGGAERRDLAIHTGFAHAPGDELGHLRPEIDDQDGVGRLDGHESP